MHAKDQIQLLAIDASEVNDAARASLFSFTISDSNFLESSVKQQNYNFSGLFFKPIASLITIPMPLSSGMPNSDVNYETTIDLQASQLMELKKLTKRLLKVNLNSLLSSQISVKTRLTFLQLSVGIIMGKVTYPIVYYTSNYDPLLLFSNLARAYSSNLAAWRGNLMKWSFFLRLMEWSRKMMRRSALTWISFSVVKAISICWVDSTAWMWMVCFFQASISASIFWALGLQRVPMRDQILMFYSIVKYQAYLGRRIERVQIDL